LLCYLFLFSFTLLLLSSSIVTKCCKFIQNSAINKTLTKITKDFSLAEMMIVMLIVSIVFAISTPMLTKQQQVIERGTVPAGSMISYMGTTIPQGWLLCDGDAVSRTIYSALFDAIGTTYGDGSGYTTFNLPHLRGRVALGIGGHAASRISITSADSLNFPMGEDSYTISINEMPSYNHGGVVAGTHTLNDPGDLHYYSPRSKNPAICLWDIILEIGLP
jgi:hypothetical protein